MEKPVSLTPEHVRDEKVKVCFSSPLFGFLWKPWKEKVVWSLPCGYPRGWASCTSIFSYCNKSRIIASKSNVWYVNKELVLITQDLFRTHCPSVKVFKPNDIPRCVCSGKGRLISCGLLNCSFFLLVFISASAEVLKNCLFLVNRCCEQWSLSVMRMWCLGNMKAIRMTQLSPKTL